MGVRVGSSMAESLVGVDVSVGMSGVRVCKRGRRCTSGRRRASCRRRGFGWQYYLTVFVTPPTHGNAILPQAAGMSTASAYRRESRASRRRPLTVLVSSPTYRSVVCAQSAGMIAADAYGCEGYIRKRRVNTVVIIPITCHRVVGAQSADIMTADAYGCEGFTRRRRVGSRIMRPQICYIPQPLRNAIRSQYGGIIPLASCYYSKSIGGGSCGFTSDGSCGRSLLNARAARVRQQDGQQMRRCDDCLGCKGRV